MVAAEVGEDHDGEPGAVDAVQVERVRRDLHRDGVGPPSRIAASRACSSGASGVVRAPVSVPSTSARSPASSNTSRSRNVVVVLPLVPGHTDHGHRAGRIAVEGDRHVGHGDARVGHHQLGHVEVEGTLHHERDRARATASGAWS